jgi:DNA-binding NarL/FixJ family response regulator
VLRLAASGLENKQIARRLGISESTVKVHIGSVFRRIGVRDRTSAAVWGMKTCRQKSLLRHSANRAAGCSMSGS